MNNKINYILLIPLLLIISCSMNPTAGGGSDLPDMKTVTGLIYDQTNTPASNTQIMVIPSKYNSQINGPIQNSSIDTTDQSGRYCIGLCDTGTYNIQAVHIFNRSRALICNIRISDDTTVVTKATIKSPGIVKVFLPDTLDTINGYIFIEGTTLFKKLTEITESNDGLFITLDSVPETILSSILYRKTDSPDFQISIADSVTVTSSDTSSTEAFVYWLNFSTGNSLPGNRVNDISIAVDSKLYMLFATSKGIAEFRMFKYWDVFTESDMGLQSGDIIKVEFVNTGNMWAVSSAGVSELSGTFWKPFTTVTSNIPTDLITDIGIELGGYGNKWFGSRDKGLIMYNDSLWTMYDTGNSTIPSNYVTSVLIDKLDTVWCTTQKGIFKLKGNYSKLITSANSNLPLDDIYCMTINKNNTKWFGYKGGVSKFDEAHNTWSHYTSSHSTVFTDSVLTIVEDNKGRIWFGGPKGLCMFDGTKWVDYRGIKYEKLTNKRVRSIAVDDYDNKWIGTDDSGVIAFGPTIRQ